MLLNVVVCQRCGNPQALPGRLCLNCRQTLPAYQALRSWAIYGGSLRQALHRLKYQGDMALGEILARPLIEMLKSLNWPVDLVTPVPCGRIRQDDRGYNQAALLARPVALGCGIQYRAAVLTKVKESRSQVGLGLNERRENVAGVFQARKKWAQSRKVLVVDDVTTSGATLEACANALLTAGAAEVYGLTLARSPQQEGSRFSQ